MPNKRFLLLYGSVTGKAQSIAELIAEEATSRGLEPDIQCMEGVDIKVGSLTKLISKYLEVAHFYL